MFILNGKIKTFHLKDKWEKKYPVDSDSALVVFISFDFL